MKKLIIGLLLLIGLTARAQVTGSFTLSTNAYAAAATNTITSDNLDCLQFRNVGLFVSAAGLGASTAVYALDFGVSNDGTNFITLAQNQVLITLNGTNTARGWTNFDSSGWRYLQVVQSRNPATNVVTNVVCQWFFNHGLK